jgi:hypothetical protein
MTLVFFFFFFFFDSPATVALRELVLTGIGFVIPLDNLERDICVASSGHALCHGPVAICVSVSFLCTSARENLHPDKKVRVQEELDSNGQLAGPHFSYIYSAV